MNIYQIYYMTRAGTICPITRTEAADHFDAMQSPEAHKARSLACFPERIGVYKIASAIPRRCSKVTS
tara:strand:- start:227 stop:427 length:201 start_codon:yes stop_codon:yes gene_type:complete